MKRVPSRSYTIDLMGHLTLGKQKVSDSGQATLTSAALANSNISATISCSGIFSSTALRNDSDKVGVTHIKPVQNANQLLIPSLLDWSVKIEIVTYQ